MNDDDNGRRLAFTFSHELAESRSRLEARREAEVEPGVIALVTQTLRNAAAVACPLDLRVALLCASRVISPLQANPTPEDAAFALTLVREMNDACARALRGERSCVPADLLELLRTEAAAIQAAAQAEAEAAKAEAGDAGDSGLLNSDDAAGVTGEESAGLEAAATLDAAPAAEDASAAAEPGDTGDDPAAALDGAAELGEAGESDTAGELAAAAEVEAATEVEAGAEALSGEAQGACAAAEAESVLDAAADANADATPETADELTSQEMPAAAGAAGEPGAEPVAEPVVAVDGEAPMESIPEAAAGAIDAAINDAMPAATDITAEGVTEVSSAGDAAMDSMAGETNAGGDAPAELDPNAPTAIDPATPMELDPNAPTAIDPSAPMALDPNAPMELDPAAPAAGEAPAGGPMELTPEMIAQMSAAPMEVQAENWGAQPLNLAPEKAEVLQFMVADAGAQLELLDAIISQLATAGEEEDACSSLVELTGTMQKLGEFFNFSSLNELAALLSRVAGSFTAPPDALRPEILIRVRGIQNLITQHIRGLEVGMEMRWPLMTLTERLTRLLGGRGRGPSIVGWHKNDADRPAPAHRRCRRGQAHQLRRYAAQQHHHAGDRLGPRAGRASAGAGQGTDGVLRFHPRRGGPDVHRIDAAYAATAEHDRLYAADHQRGASGRRSGVGGERGAWFDERRDELRRPGTGRQAGPHAAA